MGFVQELPRVAPALERVARAVSCQHKTGWWRLPLIVAFVANGLP